LLLSPISARGLASQFTCSLALDDSVIQDLSDDAAVILHRQLLVYARKRGFETVLSLLVY
jgi:hypothetical protein